MGRLQGEIDKLMEKIGGFDPHGLNRDRQKLEGKKDELRNRVDILLLKSQGLVLKTR